jgi:hypothetical protein
MKRTTSLPARLCCTVLVASMLGVTGLGPAYADSHGRGDRGDQHSRGDEGRNRGNERDHGIKWKERGDRHARDDRQARGERYVPRAADRDYRRAPPRVVYRDRWHGVPHNRIRRFRDIEIVRPYGHWYRGYGHYYRDDDAYKWLAFTAITLGVLNFMNEAQQREYESAQVAATTAPIGERIVWSEGGASGSVMATREGTSSNGRYCREFQQDVTVGGRAEEAYGTACRNPDGSWEVISSGE